eukprot:TRINITY_DN11944_c0_g1_i1.p1 TRINITY_DN11944_c0_g1~~TRINITY_DN11944_c0_g1_i1.p1  ORF type:complete len:562 (-),score=129.95 TRINITY_DN11944_c0_g1_i1:155-1840(-)
MAHHLAPIASSEVAAQLALDIVTEHFGGYAARVAKTLLSKGQLTVQETLRWVNADLEIGNQELKYPAVRNALLTLVRHGVAVARQPPNAAADEARALLMVYSIRIDDIFSRLRFPRYLEFVWSTMGGTAYDLVSTVCKYGRCTKKFVVEQVDREKPGDTTEQVFEEFEKLVSKNLFKAVQPFQKTKQTESAASKVAPEVSIDSIAQAALKKRREGEDDFLPTPREVAQTSTNVVVKADEGAKRKGADLDNNVVYAFNVNEFDLCVYKQMACSIFEDKIHTYAAKILSAMLTFVKLSENRGIETDWVPFPVVEQRVREVGGFRVGGDPARDRERLRNALNFLSAQRDSVFKQRKVQKPPGYDSMGDDETLASAKKRRLAAGEESEMAEFRLEWPAVQKLCVQPVISQLIRDRFGPVGLRIYNLLTDREPPQKLEERDIFSTCMVSVDVGRPLLNAMVRARLVNWQEVPKQAAVPLVASFWLHYVDPKRAEGALLLTAMQSILNLRISLRHQTAKVAPLESRSNTGSLTADERRLLHTGRKQEDTLERSFLVLDSVLLGFRTF